MHSPQGQALSSNYHARLAAKHRDMIADRFREAGFADLEVKGSGRTRTGQALWTHDDASADIPDEITSVEEIEA
jgi:hypothetical protein